MLARQAAFVGPGTHGIEDLGRHHDPVARIREILQRTAQHRLTRAHGIHIGGIEEGDPRLQRPADERAARLLVQHPVAPFGRAIGHGAKTDPGNLEAGFSETNLIHSLLHFFFSGDKRYGRS